MQDVRRGRLEGERGEGARVNEQGRGRRLTGGPVWGVKDLVGFTRNFSTVVNVVR